MSAFKDAGVAFLTGFLQKTADDLKTQDKKAQDFYDLQLRLVETNAPKVKQNKSVIDNLLSVSNQIKGLGGSQEMINVAKSSSPSGLTELRDKMLQAQKDYGVQWKPDFVQNVWGKIPDAVRETDAFKQYATLDSSEFFNQSYGQTGYEIGDFKAPEVGFFDRIKGKNKMAKVREELDQMDYADGMSIYDINQSANAAQYQALIPGSYIEYLTIPPFTTKDLTEFSGVLDRARNDLTDNDDYRTAKLLKDQKIKDLSSSLRAVREATNLDPKIVNIEKIKNIARGQKIDFTFKANSAVSDGAFLEEISTGFIPKYNSETELYNQQSAIMKQITQENIDSKVEILKLRYGNAVVNDAGLRALLAPIGDYTLPPKVNENGDAVSTSESVRDDEEAKVGPVDTSKWKTTGVVFSGNDNFKVSVSDGRGKFTVYINDPAGVPTVSMIDSKTGTLTSLGPEDTDLIMNSFSSVLSTENIAALVKAKETELPSAVIGGESRVGKADTEIFTQVDPEQTALMQNLQKKGARIQFDKAISRIRNKVALGYDDQPAGNIAGQIFGYATDKPKEVKQRNNSRKAALWFNGDEALEYFKQNPQQLLEATEDPVAWYLRYEEQFKAESK
tara:strand:+ start:3951 stop:5801 length:1851 start_codon:yes stop_codon:yes gene_type:complete